MHTWVSKTLVMLAVHGTIKPSPDPHVHSDLELDSKLLQNPRGAARCLLCLEVGDLMETVSIPSYQALKEYIHVCIRAKSLQSCPTLFDLMDCNPPVSSVHGILQARILE